MLRTNLSTRPFYNLRAVQLVLGALAVVAVAMTAANVIQAVRLTTSEGTLGVRAEEAEQESTRLRSEAAGLRAQINPNELQAVAGRAREANAIIDRRAFSWTELLAQFEEALPAEVRVVAVQPRLDGDAFIVSVVVQGRRAEMLDDFIEALEATGRFQNVLAVETRTDDQGLLEAVVEGAYLPPLREAGAP